MFINGKRLTSDFEKKMLFDVGKREATNHMISNKEQSNKQFEEVDWPRVDSATKDKPDEN